MISKRLQTAADSVRGLHIVDVGADHGYLAAHLAARGYHVIATEKQINPFSRGIKNFGNFRFGDGLSVIEEHEADTVIIMGMGGETIAEIMAGCPWADRKFFVLQPMSKADRLVKFLTDSHYNIIERIEVADKRRKYMIFLAEGALYDRV